jgi:hypothetical protein
MNYVNKVERWFNLNDNQVEVDYSTMNYDRMSLFEKTGAINIISFVYQSIT